MLCNACLLQRRLRDEPELKTIMRLDKVAGAKNPKEVLEIAWESILEKDYVPVFKPALAVVRALHEGRAVNNAIRALAECANRVAGLAERARVRSCRTALPSDSRLCKERRRVLHEQSLGHHVGSTRADRGLHPLVRPRSGDEAAHNGSGLWNWHAAHGNSPDNQDTCGQPQRDDRRRSRYFAQACRRRRVMRP